MKVFVRKKDHDLFSAALSFKKIAEVVNNQMKQMYGISPFNNIKIEYKFGKKYSCGVNTKKRHIIVIVSDINELQEPSKSQIWHVYGIIHELGHCIFKIDRMGIDLRSAILAEGLADYFSMLFIEVVWNELGTKAWIYEHDYYQMEKDRRFYIKNSSYFPDMISDVLIKTINQNKLKIFIKNVYNRFNTIEEMNSEIISSLDSISETEWKQLYSKLGTNWFENRERRLTTGST